MDQREVRVLNLGAGVQSTVVYLLACQGELECDVAIFADTGDEPAGVYKHLRWLQSQPGPPILVRSRGRLSDDLRRGENSTGERFASIPAYTKLPEDEEEGRVRRQCSKEYKVEVIERTIRYEVLNLNPRQRVPKDVKLTQYVGISLDESGRFERMKARRTLGEMRAPLIERFMTRQSCLAWLEERGNVPHKVPRSACVYCPFHTDEEWLAIKSVPEDWALAVEIDEALRTPGTIVNRGMDAQMFVHRSCQPLVEIDFKPKKDESRKQIELPFWRECLGVCGM